MIGTHPCYLDIIDEQIRDEYPDMGEAIIDEYFDLCEANEWMPSLSDFETWYAHSLA